MLVSSLSDSIVGSAVQRTVPVQHSSHRIVTSATMHAPLALSTNSLLPRCPSGNTSLRAAWFHSAGAGPLHQGTTEDLEALASPSKVRCAILPKTLEQTGRISGRPPMIIKIVLHRCGRLSFISVADAATVSHNALLLPRRCQAAEKMTPSVHSPICLSVVFRAIFLSRVG